MMDGTDVPGLPGTMTVRRPGGAVAAPPAAAPQPFWVELLFDSRRDGEPTMMRATFPPGVLTRWHCHPLGQLLLAVAGNGIVQRRDGPPVPVGPGDAIWFAPDEPHRHGAAPDSPFIYVSIQAVRHGSAVEWLEHADPGFPGER